MPARCGLGPTGQAVLIAADPCGTVRNKRLGLFARAGRELYRLHNRASGP